MWTAESAIESLYSAGSVAVVTIAERVVRILPEQLLRQNAYGVRQQSIRVEIGGSSAGDHLDASSVLVRMGGQVVEDVELAQGPSGCVRLFIPAVSERSKIELTLLDLDTDWAIEFELNPVREWAIHVVHHSHLDIGYTDPQCVVLASQRSYLDSALELIRSTSDWPSETRFRWVVESLEVFNAWAKMRPQHVVDEFIQYVKEGRIELTAMPYNLHTETCSTDELHELMKMVCDVRERYGVEISTAMQTDVPGCVAGLPDAFASAGVQYLSVAHNWAGRSMPQTNGGQLLPRLFRWASPAGNSVLVWMTDSPHGGAYMEGPFLGFHEGYEQVEERLPIYLESLISNPYPFPAAALGGHGDNTVVGREPYPWDVLHLRTQGYLGDNAPARLAASKIAQEWNDTWLFPKLLISTNAEFFADAEQRLAGQIRTYEGDWGDWWVDGIGSAAHPQALVREAQARVAQTQTIASIQHVLGETPMPGADDEWSEIYRTISLFNEHTWGSSNSWLTSDHGNDSGQLQWQWKAAHAIRAHELADQFAERTSSYLGLELGRGDGAEASFYVVNTEGYERDATARLFVRESTVSFGTGFCIRDARTGESLPYALEDQQNPVHRDSGRFVSVRLSALPPVGFVRLDLVIDESAVTPLNIDGDPLVMQNEFLRVTVDLARSCISSILELSSGRELINGESLFGGNEYIYDTYASAGGFNHQSNKLSSSASLELLGARTRARPSALIERANDAIEQRLTYEFAAAGVDWVRVTLRLPHGDPVLLVENRLAKPITRSKESAYFAFPFTGKDPAIRYEVSGSVSGDGLDHVPGAPQHMRAIRHWVTVESDEGALAWVTKDAPLVQRGSIALPYAPFHASTSPNEPGTIISWLHNNLWDTNFPIEQGFEATFSYAIGIGLGDDSVAATAMRTTAALVNPPLVVRATGAVDPAAAAQRSFLSIDDARVRVGALVPVEGGVLVRLQSFADEPLTVGLNVGFEFDLAHAATLLGVRREQLEVEGSTLAVSVPRLGTAAVLVEYASRK